MISAARCACERTSLKVVQGHHVFGDVDWLVVQLHKLLRTLALVAVAVVLERDRHLKPLADCLDQLLHGNRLNGHPTTI